MENHEAKFSVIRKYYTDHMHELRVFVNNRIHDAEVADDIVQNVFIRLLSIDGIVNSDTLSNLVHAIARNLICDHYRHKRYEGDREDHVSFAIRQLKRARLTRYARFWNAAWSA